jgi:hypothetical protein
MYPAGLQDLRKMEGSKAMVNVGYDLGHGLGGHLY